jgi:hypothetical protein
MSAHPTGALPDALERRLISASTDGERVSAIP